ncbi:MAG: hypothetical protein CMN30_24850 [Sandaracinus sp.]|nr:hypothetical protein [Sandaracinus sp.]
MVRGLGDLERCCAGSGQRTPDQRAPPLLPSPPGGRPMRSRSIAGMLLVGLVACEGTIGEGGYPGESEAEARDPRFEDRIWRLSPSQLQGEVEGMFGPEVPSVDLPGGAAEHGLTNIAATAVVDTGNAGRFVDTMRSVGEWVVAHGPAASRCGDTWGTSECVDGFLEWFPAEAFRRPVTAAERTELRTLHDELAAEYDADYAFAGLVRAVLLSPSFLYRIELAEGAEGSVAELDGYAIASLLSFGLTDAGPDDALMAAAGSLADPDVREAHARRLMDSSDPVWQRFFWEWLEMATLESQGNEVGLDPALVAQMEEEYRTFVSRVVVDERGTLADLMTRPQTWVRPELAAYYGVDHPGDGVQSVTMAEGQRSGLLTQAAWLVAHGKRGEANVVRRGMAVFRDAMCRDVAPLDIDLAAALADLVDPDASVRDVVVARGEDATCGACHRLADPIGLAFETFAGDGAWQTTYDHDGRPVETDILLPGHGAVDGAVDVSAALAEDHAFRSCLVRRFAHFLMGADVGDPATVRWTSEADRAFVESGGSFEELLVALVRDPAFIERKVTR